MVLRAARQRAFAQPDLESGTQVVQCAEQFRVRGTAEPGVSLANRDLAAWMSAACATTSARPSSVRRYSFFGPCFTGDQPGLFQQGEGWVDDAGARGVVAAQGVADGLDDLVPGGAVGQRSSPG